MKAHIWLIFSLFFYQILYFLVNFVQFFFSVYFIWCQQSSNEEKLNLSLFVFIIPKQKNNFEELNKVGKYLLDN